MTTALRVVPTRILRPPIIYYGGKQRIAARIAAMFPDHAHYVETHAGSLAVLLAKQPARHETVNDLDGDLMCFWRVLRDRPDELRRICALTPHARAEVLAARHRPADLDELERARRVWVLLTQHRTGTLRTQGWRAHLDASSSTHSMPRYLTSYVARMPDVAARLAAVSLESQPAEQIIRRYGAHRSTLLYVDPPYPATVRTGRNYQHDMPGEHHHRQLASALHSCLATVVLSGYPCALYDRDLYPDWYRYELPASTAQSGHGGIRCEVLWSNRPLAAEHEFRYNADENPPLGNETSGPPRCGYCQAVMRLAATGRPKRFCSNACRVRHHRHQHHTERTTQP